MVKKTLKILVIEPGEEPRVQEIEHTLAEMQKVVGGMLEMACVFPDGVDIWSNEEGKLIGLAPQLGRFNPLARFGDLYSGTLFLARKNDEGKTLSLTDADIKKYRKVFKLC